MPEQILLPKPNLPLLKRWRSPLGGRGIGWGLVIIGVILLILIGGGIISYQKGLLPLEKILPAQLLIPEKEIKLVKEKPVEEKLTEEKVEGYSQGKQIIGKETENLMLNKIRTGDHLNFFRIVFDIKNLDGSDISVLPLTRANYLPEENGIEIEIQGIEKNLAGPSIGQEKKLWDKVVASYSQQLKEDQKVKYLISLTKSSGYFLHSMLNPARIIVDIEK